MERQSLLEQVYSLRREGKSIRAIAAHLKVHPSRVQRAVKSLDQGSTPTGQQRTLPRPRDGVFVGRLRELGLLTTALDDTLSGQGRIIMLAGEPGIGKTRTARELSAYALQRGAQVLWGRCYEEPGMPPYWPWVQIIRSYVRGQKAVPLRSAMGAGAADIADVVPEVKERLPDLPPPPALEPQQAQFRLFDSIATFLTRASEDQPLVLVLDNLHWADRSSLLLLEFLAQELSECRLLLVGTYRDTELMSRHPLSSTLGELARHPHFSPVLLNGLSKEEVGSFIQARASLTAQQEIIQAVHSRTEGNPLFVTQIVQLLIQEGELTQEGGWPLRDGTLQIPAGIREVIGRRVEHLSEECNQVLTVASVVGREFGLGLLERLMAEPGMASSPGLMHGLNSESLLEALEEALAARLIEELPHTAARYQFTHVLVQNTLTQKLSAARRSRLHAHIGQAMEELYGVNAEAQASELAYHFAEAEPVLGTEKLVQYSLLAGEQALGMYAWEEARRHFELALSAKGEQPIDPQTAALLLGIGRVEAVTLEREQTVSVVPSLERAFDYYAGIGDVGRAVVVALEHPGPPVVRSPEVTRLLARALALVAGDSHQAGHLLSRYGSQLGAVDGDYEAARNAFEQALSIAHREGDMALEMRTLVDSSRADGHNCYWQASLQQSQQAIHLADLVNDPSYEVPARHWAMSAAIVLGDLEWAKEHARAGLAPAQRLRHRSMLATALSNSEIVARISGDFNAARELSDHVLTVSPQDSTGLHLRVLLECQVGELTKAEEYLAQVLQLGPPKAVSAGVPGVSNLLRSILAGWVWYMTELATGLDLAENHAKAVLSEKADWRLGKAMARAGLGLISVCKADSHAAREHYDALKGMRGTIYYGIIADDRLLGILAHTMGELNQAVAHFEGALAFCRRGYWPELAWTCHDYAKTLLQRKTPSDHAMATDLLDESLSLSRQLGMKLLMERVISLQGRVRSHPVGSPAYPGGLTERQVEVLQLISQGKTNREIARELMLSERTVQRHIADIYAKISARNRADATAFALGKLYPVK